jgi:lipoprotein-releasing system permease protein
LVPTYAWFLALRYLATRWVNVLGIAGLAVAVWALIVVIAVFSGFIAEIREHIRGATADLSLVGVGPRCSYEQVRAILERDPDVAATAPRLQHYAILFPYGSLMRRVVTTRAAESNPLTFNFVNLIGVDPARERAATHFADWLEAAPPLYRVDDPAQPFAVAAHRTSDPPAPLRADPGLLLSLKRAARGDVLRPGQRIDIVSARFDRSLQGNGQRRELVHRIRRPFTLAGAFETRHRFFDESNAFVDIEVLRDMLGHSQDDPDSVDLVTEVAIRLRPGADLAAATERLEAAVGAVSGGGKVQTWEEINAVFLGAVNQERALMKLVLFAVMLVAAFLIYATLHMMVTQKFKDIGILTSMGATPRGIAAIFVLSACAIALVGCSIGAAAGIASAHWLNDVNDWFRSRFDVELFPTSLYALPRIPYRLEAPWIAQVLAAAFGLALLVAWLPARRAARMDPVAALSYE